MKEAIIVAICCLMVLFIFTDQYIKDEEHPIEVIMLVTMYAFIAILFIIAIGGVI